MAVHVPVLLDRCVALLGPALAGDRPVLVDATCGLGGHSEALLARFPRLRVVGLDRDQQALAISADRLAPYTERVTLVHAVYDEIGDVLAGLGLPAVDGVLFDLGVSSLQLDEVSRGFSYAHDAPLDMRMDATSGATAADVVNTYPAGELARVLRVYGEERFARQIARLVVREREAAPFTSSARLVEVIRQAIPAAARRTGGNPAKRTFQALRIEVNGELDALRRAIPAALQALTVGGRIVVMSYQSLEDRLVKGVLRDGATVQAPPGMPVIPEQARPWLRLLTRGAETASAAEQEANPRAASVRLRAAEKLRDVA
ncbi:MAG: 16S rRNA (cytosine(1402)-N(4))-methyltransferase RsmH [Actinomycetota bacterium]|nr:MAG: 16S rRNA (cytosine(1402)-N(4))-methyltransferase RsmH [Actinomycetota bacterium]